MADSKPSTSGTATTAGRSSRLARRSGRTMKEFERFLESESSSDQGDNTEGRDVAPQAAVTAETPPEGEFITLGALRGLVDQFEPICNSLLVNVLQYVRFDLKGALTLMSESNNATESSEGDLSDERETRIRRSEVVKEFGRIADILRNFSETFSSGAEEIRNASAVPQNVVLQSTESEEEVAEEGAMASPPQKQARTVAMEDDSDSDSDVLMIHEPITLDGEDDGEPNPVSDGRPLQVHGTAAAIRKRNQREIFGSCDGDDDDEDDDPAPTTRPRSSAVPAATAFAHGQGATPMNGGESLESRCAAGARPVSCLSTNQTRADHQRQNSAGSDAARQPQTREDERSSSINIGIGNQSASASPQILMPTNEKQIDGNYSRLGTKGDGKERKLSGNQPGPQPRPAQQPHSTPTRVGPPEPILSLPAAVALGFSKQNPEKSSKPGEHVLPNSAIRSRNSSGKENFGNPPADVLLQSPDCGSEPAGCPPGADDEVQFVSSCYTKPVTDFNSTASRFFALRRRVAAARTKAEIHAIHREVNACRHQLASDLSVKFPPLAGVALLLAFLADPSEDCKLRDALDGDRLQVGTHMACIVAAKLNHSDLTGALWSDLVDALGGDDTAAECVCFLVAACGYVHGHRFLWAHAELRHPRPAPISSLSAGIADHFRERLLAVTQDPARDEIARLQRSWNAVVGVINVKDASVFEKTAPLADRMRKDTLNRYWHRLRNAHPNWDNLAGSGFRRFQLQLPEDGTAIKDAPTFKAIFDWSGGRPMATIKEEISVEIGDPCKRQQKLDTIRANSVGHHQSSVGTAAAAPCLRETAAPAVPQPAPATKLKTISDPQAQKACGVLANPPIQELQRLHKGGSTPSFPIPSLCAEVPIAPAPVYGKSPATGGQPSGSSCAVTNVPNQQHHQNAVGRSDGYYSKKISNMLSIRKGGVQEGHGGRKRPLSPEPDASSGGQVQQPPPKKRGRPRKNKDSTTTNAAGASQPLMLKPQTQNTRFYPPAQPVNTHPRSKIAFTGAPKLMPLYAGGKPQVTGSTGPVATTQTLQTSGAHPLPTQQRQPFLEYLAPGGGLRELFGGSSNQLTTETADRNTTPATPTEAPMDDEANGALTPRGGFPRCAACRADAQFHCCEKVFYCSDACRDLHWETGHCDNCVSNEG